MKKSAAIKKILVCDDDPDILELVALMLRSNGYYTVCELNSPDIYKKIDEENPDAIVLDLWMPILSGEKIIKVLKRDQKTKHIPIIVISASNDGKEIAERAGADDFIGKPFDIDTLLRVVNKN